MLYQRLQGLVSRIERKHGSMTPFFWSGQIFWLLLGSRKSVIFTWVSAAQAE